jgi:hypothetical protein
MFRPPKRQPPQPLQIGFHRTFAAPKRNRLTIRVPGLGLQLPIGLRFVLPKSHAKWLQFLAKHLAFACSWFCPYIFLSLIFLSHFSV